MATNNFKTECNNPADSNRLGKVTIGNTELNQSNYLSSIEINDSCILNDVIVGNVTSKSLKFNSLNYTDNIVDSTVNAQVGIRYSNNTTEYEDLGNFTITKETIDDTGTTASYEGLDALNKLDEVYTCGISDANLTTATIGDFWLDACSQANLTPLQTTFTNSTIVVGGNPFTNNETIRTVLSNVASAGLYFIDIDINTSKIALKWLGTTTAQTFTKSDYSTLEKNQTYGPIDCLVIRDTYTEGENVTRGIGDNIFYIDDNYFLYTEALRTQAIDNIWSKVQGLTYVDFKMVTYTGRPYLKKGDKISIQDMDGNYFTSYVLTHKFTYDGSFASEISATALTNEQTALKNTQQQSITKSFRNTQRVVDKINGVITDTVEQVEDNTRDIAQLKIDSESIELRVESVETTQIDAVTNEYAVNNSATTPPAQSSSDWSENQPTRQEGQYIWARIKTTYHSGTIDYSEPVCTTGDKGDTGQSGSAGKGISSINTYYKTTSTQTQPSASSITSTSIPTMDATDNKYLWQKQVTNYTTGNPTTIITLIGVYGQTGPQGETGATGATGPAGNGISSITYYYKATSTQTAPSASSITGTSIPTLDATTNKYLWEKEVIAYTDNTNKTTVSLKGVYGDTGLQGPQGETGQTGATGNGISSITYYYKATSDQTAPSASSVTSTTIPTLDGTTNKYLWEKEVIAYTNNTNKTTVSLKGVYGDKGNTGDTGPAGADGNGIQSITYYYATSTTQTAPSASSITSTTIPTLSATNKYLWQKEVIKYTKSGVSDKVTVLLIAVYGDKGDKGDDGDDGASINTITEYYAVSTSNTTAPTTWTTDLSTITLTATNKYLWNYSVITYTEGKASTTTASKVIGVYGDQGERGQTGATGTGVSSITEEYYLSTSKTTQTGGSWTTTPPTWESGKYIWTRSKIVYTNPSSTSYTTPVCSSEWEAVNDIEIGGTNLIKNSNFFRGTTNWTADSGTLTVEDDSVYKYHLKVVMTGGTPRVYSNTSNVWKTGQEYTYSFYAKADSAQTIRPSRSIVDFGQTHTITTSWQRFTGIINSTATVDSGTLSFSFGNLNVPTYIANVKLEIGNQSTQWSPSPLDEIQKLDVQYYLSTSSSTPTGGSWSTTAPAWVDGKYMWSRQVITYGDGTTSTKNQTCIAGATGATGADGQDGTDGTDGRGIVSVVQHYLATSASSGVTTSTSGWTTTVQTMTSTNKYLWNYTTTTYTSGTITENSTPCIIGVYGLTGNTGKGITSVTPLYYCSSSSTAPAKPTAHVTTSNVGVYNAWNIKCATYTTTYKYYYTCSEILYTDGTYAWTDVVTDQSVMFVNDLKIGGRNLLLGTLNPMSGTGTGGTNQTTGLYLFSDFYNEQYKPSTATTGESITVTMSCDWETTATSGTFQIQLGGWPYTVLIPTQTVSGTNQSGHVERTATISKNADHDTAYTRLSLRLDNLTGDVTISNAKVEIGNKASDWTQAPEDIQKDIDDVSTALPNYVTKSYYDSDWLVKKGQIEGYAESTFTTSTEFGEFTEYARGQFALIPDGVRIEAIATSTFNNNITGIQDTIDDVRDTFDFTTNGLIIKKTGNTLYMQLENDELAFRTDDTPAGKKAYMTSNAFVLKELDTLQLGNYAFKVKDNGSVDFKKIV